MREVFISYDTAKTNEAAKTIAPWAYKIVRVEGGWLAFESADDYHTWKSQV